MAVLCIGLMPWLAPKPAHAYVFYQPDLGIDTVVTGNDCWNHVAEEWNMPCVELEKHLNRTDAEVCPGPGLTRRIMPCVKETLLNATNMMLIPFSQYMATTVTVVCTLAIALLGGLLIGGKTTAPFKDSLVLLLKLALISTFSFNFGGFLGLVLNSMDSMLGLFANTIIFSGTFAYSDVIQECPYFRSNPDNYYFGWVVPGRGWTIQQDPPLLQIWDGVDCALNSIMGGINSNFSLTMGITGFLLACMGSNMLGFIIGFMGFRLVIQMLWALIRSLYIFIAAYMGICLMVLVSPLFIPAVAFQATRGYFERWLKTFIGFIVQPLILFAYLAMLLTAFDVVIFSGPNSLVKTMIGPDADDPNFRRSYVEGGLGGFGGWMMANGAYARDYKAPLAVNIHAKRAKMRKDAMLAADTMDAGAGGIRASRLVRTSEDPTDTMSIDTNKQRALLKRLGLGGLVARDAPPGAPMQDKPLNYFEFNLPVQVVDWAFLAGQNGFDPENEDSVLDYMLRVFIAFLMAMITGYVFIELLETLPLIGNGIASGSGVVEERALGSGGLAKMGPPGTDFMKNLKSKLLSG
jgi:hypothetical protein